MSAAVVEMTTAPSSTSPAAATGDDIESGGITVSHLPPEPELQGGLLKPIPQTTPAERVAGAVAFLAIGTSLAAMAIEQSAIVIIGGILSSIMGPYAYYQQTMLTDIRTLQETKKAVENEVNKLEAENKKLSNNINQLTESVNRLHEIEDALNLITKTQGQSVDAFAKQVQDNKDILKSMQTNLKATVLQNLLSVILRSDADGDMIINEPEIDDLSRRIQNISGVTIYEDRFRKAISGQSVNAVMDIVRNLLDESTPQEERIFELAQ